MFLSGIAFIIAFFVCKKAVDETYELMIRKEEGI
jgi:hypothetical protein